MSYCGNCGEKIEADQDVCLHCGSMVNNSYKQTKKPVYEDNGGFGYGLLGFCIPLAGLILFLIWNTDKPKSAKAAGLGALFSVIATIVLSIIFVIIIFALASSNPGIFDDGYYHTFMLLK